VLAPVPLQTVCLRHEPPGLDGATLDEHTRRWVEAINRGGAAYLTPAVLRGRWMVRVSVGTLPTERAHVEALWQLMREAAESTAAAGAVESAG
jgi:aromatic-L-amino-acid decarboxylase